MFLQYTGTYIGGWVDPDFPNPNGPDDVPIIIYGYTPSFTLAVFAAGLFTLSLIAHSWQVLRYRCWYFATFPIGLVFEIVGYISRSLSARIDPYNLIYFVLNYFFIVTAPVFLSAGIYAILSVLINQLGREYSPIVPRAILWIFITSDVISTILQITGAAIIGSRQAKRLNPDIGSHILLGGLSYQVFSMGVFCVLAGLFVFRARKAINLRSLNGFTIALVLATILIYLRTCFRLVETAQGLAQYLSSHEIFFATLEFTPVALAVLSFIVWYPGRCMVKAGSC
jgi:hypothetical protein